MAADHPVHLRMHSPQSFGHRTCVVLEAAWNLVMGTRIRADRQRLALALSLPEYMETWMEIPGAAISPARIMRSAAEFEIRSLSVDGERIRIHGAYRAIRSTRVVFTWQKDIPGNGVESVVRVALQGDFAYTRLTLSQMGLTSERDYRWHRELWHRSLARLARLFS